MSDYGDLFRVRLEAGKHTEFRRTTRDELAVLDENRGVDLLDETRGVLCGHLGGEARFADGLLRLVDRGPFAPFVAGLRAAARSERERPDEHHPKHLAAREHARRKTTPARKKKLLPTELGPDGQKRICHGVVVPS